MVLCLSATTRDKGFLSYSFLWLLQSETRIMSRVTSSALGAFHTDDFRIDGFVHDGPYWELPIEVLPRVITDEEDSEEPPDGGVLAWLHVFVGFFIIMNAQ